MKQLNLGKIPCGICGYFFENRPRFNHNALASLLRQCIEHFDQKLDDRFLVAVIRLLGSGLGGRNGRLGSTQLGCQSLQN